MLVRMKYKMDEQLIGSLHVILVGGCDYRRNYSNADGVPIPHAPVRQRTPVMGQHYRPAARRLGTPSAGSVYQFLLFIPFGLIKQFYLYSSVRRPLWALFLYIWYKKHRSNRGGLSVSD